MIDTILCFRYLSAVQPRRCLPRVSDVKLTIQSVFLMKGIPPNESQIRWAYGAVLRSGLGRFFSWLP